MATPGTKKKREIHEDRSNPSFKKVVVVVISGVDKTSNMTNPSDVSSKISTISRAWSGDANAAPSTKTLRSRPKARRERAFHQESSRDRWRLPRSWNKENVEG